MPLMQPQRPPMMRSTRKMQAQGESPVSSGKLYIPATRKYLLITASRVQNNAQKYTWPLQERAGKELGTTCAMGNQAGFSACPNILWPGLEQHNVSGFLSSGDGLQAALSPHPSSGHCPTIRGGMIVSRDTPSLLSRYLVYGNRFALRWRFLGSDLGRPWFLSNTF